MSPRYATPDGTDCAGTGVTVTAGTGDIIQVVNSAGGTSITYDIIVIGTSV